MGVDYSRLAGDYDAVRADDAIDRGFWLAGIRDAGRLRPGDRILDLGAGTGRFSRFFAEFARVVAFDASRGMLARAGPKGGFARVLGDAHALPFRDGSFDAAVAVMVLHQLREYSAALREAARVARRIAIASTDMSSRDLGILAEAFPSLEAIDRARFPPVRGIVESLKAAGFYHVVAKERTLHRVFTVEHQLERVRRKYISSLDLIRPEEFAAGLAFLEREMPRRYGDTFDFDAGFIFLGASR